MPSPGRPRKRAGQGFADRVGQKKWIPAPDPFGIATDYVAGVRLFESKQDRQMAIKFGEGRPEDKPSQAVIDTMKQAGYRWNPSDRIWAHPVLPESAMSTRIEAKRLYEDVCQMIRQEKGIEPEQGPTAVLMVPDHAPQTHRPAARLAVLKRFRRLA